MGDWTTNQGAIVERPGEVDRHPLLAAIYRRQDGLVREWTSKSRTAYERTRWIRWWTQTVGESWR